MVDATAGAARVLIVERDARAATETSDALASFGYRVVAIAGQSADAIRLAVLHRPALALLELPQKDELATVEVARRLLHELSVAVVFMTAQADARTLRRAAAALPLGYLVTPFDRQELRATVSIALTRHTAERRAPDMLQNFEMLGELAGGVAHDFNNLLSVILGHASLCAEAAPPQSAQARSLEQIMIASERGVGLCNQLRAYAGTRESAREPLDVNRCVQETVQLLRILMGDNASLVLDLEAGLPSPLVDRSQIQRVMMNLVINAAESLETLPGKVTVRTARTWLGPQDIQELQIGRELGAGAYVGVEVTDTGHGMDSETIRRIFDPFFTTKIGGRGLGLAAVQGIVRAHKAALHVVSEAGQGTSFHLLLPVAERSVRVGMETPRQVT